MLESIAMTHNAVQRALAVDGLFACFVLFNLFALNHKRSASARTALSRNAARCILYISVLSSNAPSVVVWRQHHGLITAADVAPVVNAHCAHILPRGFDVSSSRFFDVLFQNLVSYAQSVVTLRQLQCEGPRTQDSLAYLLHTVAVVQVMQKFWFIDDFSKSLGLNFIVFAQLAYSHRFVSFHCSFAQ